MREYAVVDVFTDVPLQGNPVAVFIDGTGLSAEVMQRTARELNLSETVFVLPGGAGPPGDGEDAAMIRIFTPTVELPFAGHPVLGTAFVVGSRGGGSTVRLATAAGVVPVRLVRDDRGEIVVGEMEQPVAVPEPFEYAPELLRALGVERSGLPLEAYRNGPMHVYVELPSEEAVAALAPDMRTLAAIGEFGVSCFTRAGDGGFRTRMFAPALGVAEDPATGSAAGPLALHLVRHGRVPYGEEIEIRQGVEIGRPSVLRARVEGSRERLERVVVAGAAVIVASGRYRLV